MIEAPVPISSTKVFHLSSQQYSRKMLVLIYKNLITCAFFDCVLMRLTTSST